MEEDSSVVPRHDQLREEIHAVIFAQQTALEILTNICCDDETWEDVASDSGESDMVEESEEDDSIVPEDSKVNEVNICKMPPIALEAVQAHQLLSKVVDKAVMPAENVQELLTAPNAGRHELIPMYLCCKTFFYLLYCTFYRLTKSLMYAYINFRKKIRRCHGFTNGCYLAIKGLIMLE